MVSNILLIEDSMFQALRIKLELLRHGAFVEVANTGSSGLAMARSQRPSAIVLDIDLPELDGYSVCEVLKADPTTAHIPVIMLTQHDTMHAALKGLWVGADDYIPKDAFAEHNLVESLRYLGML